MKLNIAVNYRLALQPSDDPLISFSLDALIATIFASKAQSTYSGPPGSSIEEAGVDWPNTTYVPVGPGISPGLQLIRRTGPTSSVPVPYRLLDVNVRMAVGMTYDPNSVAANLLQVVEPPALPAQGYSPNLTPGQPVPLQFFTKLWGPESNWSGQFAPDDSTSPWSAVLGTIPVNGAPNAKLANVDGLRYIECSGSAPDFVPGFAHGRLFHFTTGLVPDQSQVVKSAWPLVSRTVTHYGVDGWKYNAGFIDNFPGEIPFYQVFANVQFQIEVADSEFVSPVPFDATNDVWIMVPGSKTAYVQHFTDPADTFDLVPPYAPLLAQQDPVPGPDQTIQYFMMPLFSNIVQAGQNWGEEISNFNSNQYALNGDGTPAYIGVITNDFHIAWGANRFPVGWGRTPFYAY